MIPQSHNISVSLQFDFLILPNFQISFTFQFFFLSIGQNVFSTNHLAFSIFLHKFPKRFESFSLIDPPVFLYYLLLGIWRFFTYTYNYIYSYVYLHTYWNLFSREKAIIMMWSCDLVT